MIIYIGITFRQFIAELIHKNFLRNFHVICVPNPERRILGEVNINYGAKNAHRTKKYPTRTFARGRNPHGMLAIIHQEKRATRKSITQGRRNGSR